ncbi:hypothetical protein CBR_g18566 [Chara braunii]|uniref:Uncharacterized protein n=1 Tax=Chara braunii TaxID=69332 RepID=A0A388JT38_CHABU|nr:hypothetical protein CBR_g18566 [Chara braunii]|eukprot:GBG60968.1 hypothetical protein CBR_g18566 [Chara braunii]
MVSHHSVSPFRDSVKWGGVFSKCGAVREEFWHGKLQLAAHSLVSIQVMVGMYSGVTSSGTGTTGSRWSRDGKEEWQKAFNDRDSKNGS